MIGKLALMMIIACLLSLGFAQGDGIAGNDSQYNLTKGTLIDTNESFVVIHMDDPSNNSNQSDGSYLVRKINLTSNELTLDNCSPYIQGISFNDINGNGIKDRNENGLAGWIVKLTKPDGTVASTSTAQSGSYFFASIQPGDYIVSENCHDQWIQTAPSISYYSVTVSNEDITPLNFGNAFVGSKNNPPAAPAKPTGPVSCITGESHSYSTLATDPDSDQIQYTFDWGDGSPTADTSFVNSGTSASLSHTWSTAGIYNVQVKATDSNGAASDLSDTLEVSINSLPGTPATPSGSTSGVTGTSYQYTTSATDSDGDQVKYTFDWGDGSPTVDTALVNSGTSASLSHTWSAAGTYDVKVKATDSKGAASGWSNVLAVSINSPPGTPATPSGSTSGLTSTSYQYTTSATDSDGDQVKYTFDWGDGSPTADTALVNSGTSASLSHTWSTAGTYNVKVKATDSKGAASGWSNVLAVSIGVPNSPPGTPSTPAGQTAGTTGTSYTYTTSATDSNNDQIKYTFDWGDTTTPTVTGLFNSAATANAAHTWAAAGTYSVKVKATDANNAESGWSDILTVTITGANVAPGTPSTPAGQTAGTTGTSYTYTTSATDSNNDQIKYTFDWGDTTTPTVTGLFNSAATANAAHTWAAAGTYSVKVKATDANNAESGWSDILTVTITGANVAPGTPSTPAGQTAGTTGTSYTYTTSATDSNNDQIKYTFDWGDTTTPTVTGLFNSAATANAAHTWVAAGTYSVKVKATDANNAESGWSDILTVTITGANVAPGTPSTPAGQTAGTTGTSYTYTTSATDSNNDQIKYTFDWGDTTTLTVTGLFNSAATANAAHTWVAAGTYSVKVKATDANNAESGWSNVLSVTIAAPNVAPGTPSTPAGQIAGTAGTSYTYTTSATDSNNDQIKYTFDWGDGSPTVDTALVNSGTSASLSHKWSTAGTYNVKVKAMDAGGLESPEWSQALTVTITLSNAAPGTPAITAGPTTGYGAVSYQYTVSATDPGDQIKYTFNWGDQTSTTTGFFASGAPTSASHIWSAAGPYTVTVKATDTSNVDSAGLGTITVVISPNNPPTAPAIPAGISSGIAGTQYNFNTFASDPDYNTIKYTFDWDDGSTSESAMASSSQKVYMAHAWSAKGTFNIRAKATDSNGAQSAWSSARQVTMN